MKINCIGFIAEKGYLTYHSTYFSITLDTYKKTITNYVRVI